jgi:uncharacterized protein
VGLLKNFSIPFAGLNLGTHDFEFQAGDEFFGEFGESEISDISLGILITLQKHERMMLLHFVLRGEAGLICDRCLDQFIYKIDSSFDLVVKIGAVNSEETDEVINISEKEHELNIAQFIYEYTLLSLPTKRVHPENENGVPLCNREVLDQLKKHYKPNNTSGDPDPRWEILKKVTFNQN